MYNILYYYINLSRFERKVLEIFQQNSKCKYSNKNKFLEAN